MIQFSFVNEYMKDDIFQLRERYEFVIDRRGSYTIFFRL